MQNRPFRERLALSLSPFIVRVMLAVTFIWAGATKFADQTVSDPTDIATLAQLDVIPQPAEGVEAAPVTIKRHEGVQMLLENAANPKPIEVTQTLVTPAQPNVESETSTLEDLENQVPFPPPGNDPASEPEIVPETKDEPTSPPQTRDDTNEPNILTASFVQPTTTKTPMAIWPSFLSGATMTKVMALALVGTELLGGFLLLIGLLSRFAALGLAIAMLVAMWLTQFGPAIQSGDTFLGFLPNLAWHDSGWMTLLWQFALFAASLAIFVGGPGSISLDSRLFNTGRRPRDYDDDYFDDDDD